MGVGARETHERRFVLEPPGLAEMAISRVRDMGRAGVVLLVAFGLAVLRIPPLGASDRFCLFAVEPTAGTIGAQHAPVYPSQDPAGLDTWAIVTQATSRRLGHSTHAIYVYAEPSDSLPFLTTSYSLLTDPPDGLARSSSPLERVHGPPLFGPSGRVYDPHD